MPSQHRHPSHGFRPDPGEFAAARDRLEARGRTVGAYLHACLRWLNRDPDAALAAVAGSWPEPRPPGRPRSSRAPAGSQGRHAAGGLPAEAGTPVPGAPAAGGPPAAGGRGTPAAPG